MKIKENESLAKYTTFRMGGTAAKMLIPESVEELTDLVREDRSALDYVIGGGSNLLINDNRVFPTVLCLREFNTRIESLQNGFYYIGASVRLQKAIQRINQEGYGGIEYLFSVPGLIGGAIVMNAGRGKKYNMCISDYIQSVDVLVDGEMRTLPKDECHFSYRHSIFQEMPGCVVTGASFCFPSVDAEESAARIRERLELCKSKQDMTAPNFGTVFCQSNKYIMAIVKKLRPGYKNGCAFSAKASNWMLHGEKGTFKQATTLINRVIRWHSLLGQKCRPEVKIWD